MRNEVQVCTCLQRTMRRVNNPSWNASSANHVEHRTSISISICELEIRVRNKPRLYLGLNMLTAWLNMFDRMFLMISTLRRFEWYSFTSYVHGFWGFLIVLFSAEQLDIFCFLLFIIIFRQ